MAEPTFVHEPVMLREVLDHLEPERGGWFLDATVGGGGHALALLSAEASVRLVGLDRDPSAIEAAGRRLQQFRDRVRLVRANYRDFGALWEREGWPPLTGALLDLGLSSEQIDNAARGFSFRPGTSLDMRMGGTAGGERPAADRLNRASEAELGRVFREYGDERRWRALAREIVRRRRERPLRTSDDLLAAIEAVLGPRCTNQDRARLFQAVRIWVNDELGALQEGLESIRTTLGPGGRLVVISYHSLEDRIVKRAFREWSRACVCPPEFPVCRCRGRPLGEPVTKRPRRPTQAEIDRNPRARSARLRVWERW